MISNFKINIFYQIFFLTPYSYLVRRKNREMNLGRIVLKIFHNDKKYLAKHSDLVPTYLESENCDQVLDTIIAPNITEKSTSLSEFNKVVFKVHNGATKNSIKKSVEKTFKVNVIKVNTLNLKRKTKMVKNKKGNSDFYHFPNT